MKTGALQITYKEDSSNREGAGLGEKTFTAGVRFTADYDNNARIFAWICNAARLTLQQQGVLR